MATELHLGLTLSNLPGSLHHRNGLSSYSGDHRLGASIEGHGSSISIDDNQGFCFSNKKRRLEEAPEADTASSDSLRRTLPLFSWNDHPNEDDDRRDRPSSCSLAAIENGDESDGVVGWPPINSYRKRHCEVTGGESKCMYVKVQMEGVVIARKIDLSLHRSYDTLISTILFMFGRDPHHCKPEIPKAERHRRPAASRHCPPPSSAASPSCRSAPCLRLPAQPRRVRFAEIVASLVHLTAGQSDVL